MNLTTRAAELILERGRCYWTGDGKASLQLRVLGDQVEIWHLIRNVGGGMYPHPYKNPVRWYWALAKKEELTVLIGQLLAKGALPERLQLLESLLDGLPRPEKEPDDASEGNAE